MQVGDVTNMTHWTHYQPDIQCGYKAPRGRVGVFLLLGDADKKAPETFDPVAAIRALGWVPGAEFDEAEELELCRAAWTLDSSAPFPDFWLGWQACARARAEVHHG
nr:hypothetical protein [uncultured Pseudomonas sp.]